MDVVTVATVAVEVVIIVEETVTIAFALRVVVNCEVRVVVAVFVGVVVLRFSVSRLLLLRNNSITYLVIVNVIEDVVVWVLETVIGVGVTIVVTGVSMQLHNVPINGLARPKRL